MLNVPIDRIVPLTDARDNFSRIVADIENQTDGLYVLTKGGKPAIALVNISYLAELMKGTASLPKPHSPVEVKSTPAPTHASSPKTAPVNEKIDNKPTPPPMSPPPVGGPPQQNNSPINPTWTNNLPKNKPVSPWPIAPSAPKPVTIPPPPPPPVVPPAPPTPPKPPPPPVPVNSPVAPPAGGPMPPPPPPPPVVPPTPPPPPPPPPKVELPPPPENPTTIPFDQQPKTILEPGEEAPPPAGGSAPQPPAVQKVEETKPTEAPHPLSKPQIQDIEI